MPPIQVVTTTNFVADWARVVGGDRVEVFSLLPVGGDPHHFQPGPRDVARVADADLVLSVGLYLEAAWLEELLHNASADESKIVALGESVDPIEFAMDDMHDDHEDEGDGDHGDHEDEGDGDHGDHEGHAHGTFDPHFWFDPVRVKIAVNENSRSAFGYRTSERECLLPERLRHMGRSSTSFTPGSKSRLALWNRSADCWLHRHDSLSYFAKAYGFEVVGLVIPSLSTHVEPSAEHIAGLVEVIREHDVPAVFGETTVSDRLAQAVARETGAELVQLYSGSLGPDGSGADTHLGMVRTNVERIVGALK